MDFKQKITKSKHHYMAANTIIKGYQKGKFSIR